MIRFTPCFLYVIFSVILSSSCSSPSFSKRIHAQNEDQSSIVRDKIDKTQLRTPEDALKVLQEGNQRFFKNRTISLPKANEFSEEDSPFAAVLSCSETKNSPEVLFDQNVNDLFSVRVSGNILNQDVLGSLEYATHVKGAKLIVVMGHTGCGNVEGACKDIRLGNMGHITSEVRSALYAVKKIKKDFNSNDKEHQDLLSEESVKKTVQSISTKSDVIRSLVSFGKVKVVGAMLNSETGEVRFLF